MASLMYDNETAVLQFAFNGRRTIRLGRRSEDRALLFKRRLEGLIVCVNHADPLSAELSAWLLKMPDDDHEKLANVGLVTPRGLTLLGGFIESYIAGRVDLDPDGRSLINLRIAAGHLTNYFGADRSIRDITPDEADKFSAHAKSIFAEATASRVVGRAKQFYKAAIRAKLVGESPFADIKLGSQENEDRQDFIDRERIAKVIEACPDAEWRLIVALSRFGGIRCPSETLNLKWDEINWEQSRFLVRKHKTKSRVVPIFPELLPHLRDCYELAKPGAVHVIARYRGSETNLRTSLIKIIERAGLMPWEKTFHNLRASRQTELAEDHPIHVVCAWIGNSVKIAKKHYLMVRDSDYDKATGAAKSAALTPFTGFTGEQQDMEKRALVDAERHTFHSLQGITDGSSAEYPDQDSIGSEKPAFFPSEPPSAVQKPLHSGETSDALNEPVQPVKVRVVRPFCKLTALEIRAFMEGDIE